MARQITAIDEAILAFAPEAVHAVLADLARYHEWWGPPFKFTTRQDNQAAPGTRVHIQHDFVQWDATLTHVDPERIVIQYDGSWTGDTRWHVTPCQEGARVIYRIDLDPSRLWLKVLSRGLDLKRRHSMLMMDVFKHLDARLTQIGAPAVAPPMPPGATVGATPSARGAAASGR